MFKKLRYIIITVMFLSLSVVFGGKTLYSNIKPVAVATFSAQSTEGSSNIFDKILKTSESLINNTNNTYDTNLSGKRYFIEAYGATQLLLDKTLIEDPQVGYLLKDNSGMLHFADYNVDTTKEANMLKEINEYMKSIDTPFVFVTALSKNIENETKFKKGVEIYANSNTNRHLFYKALENYDMDYLDLNQSEDLLSMDKNNLFFKTDHHWKTETAFWAYTKILDYINEKYFNESIDTSITTNLNNYQKIELKNSFLGSIGKRMGEIYSGIDNYTYYIPKFETDYSVYIGYDKQAVAYGSFEDTIINKMCSDPSQPKSTNRYGTYFGMDRDFQTMINNKCNNDYKVLIIKDSYGLPVSAFLSLNFKEVTMVDLRLAKEQSVKEFIRNGNYDLVIMNYGVGSMALENMFELK